VGKRKHERFSYAIRIFLTICGNQHAIKILSFINMGYRKKEVSHIPCHAKNQCNMYKTKRKKVVRNKGRYSLQLDHRIRRAKLKHQLLPLYLTHLGRFRNTEFRNRCINPVRFSRAVTSRFAVERGTRFLFISLASCYPAKPWGREKKKYILRIHQNPLIPPRTITLTLSLGTIHKTGIIPQIPGGNRVLELHVLACL
jgi:hypothetical protein